MKHHRSTRGDFLRIFGAFIGPTWPQGGYRIEFQFCLGEKSQTMSFYYMTRHHDPIRRRVSGQKPCDGVLKVLVRESLCVSPRRREVSIYACLPVRDRLVQEATDWRWSSARWYQWRRPVEVPILCAQWQAFVSRGWSHTGVNDTHAESFSFGQKLPQMAWFSCFQTVSPQYRTCGNSTGTRIGSGSGWPWSSNFWKNVDRYGAFASTHVTSEIHSSWPRSTSRW